jgi:hypothetical protein
LNFIFNTEIGHIKNLLFTNKYSALYGYSSYFSNNIIDTNIFSGIDIKIHISKGKYNKDIDLPGFSISVSGRKYEGYFSTYLDSEHFYTDTIQINGKIFTGYYKFDSTEISASSASTSSIKEIIFVQYYGVVSILYDDNNYLTYLDL